MSLDFRSQDLRNQWAAAVYHQYSLWHQSKLLRAGAPVMENAFGIPTLSGPIIPMVSSSDSREGARLPAASHPFPGQTLDKDLPGPPSTTSLSTASLIYRGEHGFPAPLSYGPLPPFVRTNMGLLSSGSTAFRHLGSHDGGEAYHSAFTPAKKSKGEDGTSTATFSDHHDHSFDKDGEGSRKSRSPSVKEERPSSISSAGGDTNSEIHSDNGELYDSGTPDSEGRSLRKARKRPVDGLVCCPVCGLTLRPGETEAHLSVELDKLEKICRGGRKSRDSTPSGRKTLPSPSGRKGKDSPSLEVASKTRFESYLRIRCNRQSRLTARSRNRKRRGEETVCPVCSERLSGTPEDLNGHVELCLKRRQHEDEEEQVDVEGDGGMEVYTWAGQTRIRASTLLEGGYKGQGFLTASSKRQSEDEGDLNVDGDDTEQYGVPQYSESDLVRLRLDGEQPSTSMSGDVLAIKKEAREPTPGCSQNMDVDLPLDLCQSESMTHAGQGALVSALKARLRELETSRDAKQKCLICMNQYQDPLVSTQCWHVHCESCWLHTLGAKKVCPQCNMITSPAELRRIFL